MPLITETYYLSLTQDNRGILRLRCSQDDTLRTVNLKLYNNGSIFVIPSGVSASISGVKQNGAVFSKPCTISQDRESVVLQLSSDITNVDGIIVAEIVLNDGEGGRLGTSNFIIQVEKNPIRAGVVQDTETPIEYINDFIEKIQTLTARLNNLITPSGDASLAEVVDARVGILDNTTYQTLGARLNAEFQRLRNALNGVTILESTGDTTDRTSEILSKLNTYGTCKLGKGDFYVSSLVMPEGSHLVGSGNSTRIVLPSSVTDGYVVKPRSNCIIENVSFYGGFTGTHSELIDSSSIATRHCIILDRFNSVSSENVILSNILINNFVGSAIIQRYTTGCHCKDVVISMCYAGIDISNTSYDGLCTNIYMNDTRYGVVQNGSNFVFSGCISKDSQHHIMSDQQNTECIFSSCTFFDSSLETTSRLAYLSNVRNGFVFDNCMFDSSLRMILNACDGIVIKGTNFVGSDTFAITVANSRNSLLLITDCIADVEPVVTNAGTAAHITSCYLKDGTAWSISETQDDSGGSSTLAELTDTDISSEQDGQVLTYDGTSHKWVNHTPSGSSVEIEVDDELSDESENPVQNKIINRAVSEIKADLDAFSDVETENIKSTDVRNYVINETSGQVMARSAQRSMTMQCKENTTYIIKNPCGNKIVVGSSAEYPTTSLTFTHFADLTSSLPEAEYTTGSGEVYLMVTYWNNYQTYTDAQALEALEVYHETKSAYDKTARAEMTELSEYVEQEIAYFYDDALVKSRNLCDAKSYCRLGSALNPKGILAGNYQDRCTFAYIPVHGLDSIVVAILSNSNTNTTGRYCWYDANKTPILLDGQTNPTVGGLKYRTKDAVVLTVPSNAYYFAFQVYYEHCILDGNGYPRVMVEDGTVYTRYTPFGNIIVNTPYTGPKGIYVCASDSEEKYRMGCDFYCDGINDEITLQAAMDACGNVGTLYLAPGKYHIDSIPLQEDGQYCALQFRTAKDYPNNTHRVRIKGFDQTPMRTDGYSNIEKCAVLVVSANCYDTLDTENTYSIIGVERDHSTLDRIWNGACFDISGVGVMIPGNQKKVVAFDAWYAFCIMMERCMATTIPTNAMPSAAGNEDCIGIKCTKGSNFGQCSQLTSCAMYGFGQGIAVSGEHYVLTNCKSIYNKYGFTFNWYGDNSAGYTHPNTLINCCSEMDFNYPYFGYNAQLSSVTLIDFNIEYRTASAALGGELAQERTPGTWRGTINYTIKTYTSDGYAITGNNVAMPFWKTGHGANVKSHNDAQKQICSTTERNNYAANEMQRVYDSTAEKFYTYVNDLWVEG